ncbi:MAG: zinc-binding dehydrogenase [Lapillicoccus sp.]
MRAVVTRTPGLVEVLEVATPQPAADQVRIHVEAATVNPADGAVVAGIFASLIHQLDHTGLGWDAAGTISAVGANVATTHPQLLVGARVAALSGGFDKPLGALAEELVVPAADVALLPAGLDTTEAATVPLNSLTASLALGLLGEPAGTLLVTGAAGAVGGYALPLAFARGWEVVGLARESDRDFVGGSGAKLVTSLDGVTVDAVIDAASLGTAALGAVRDGGRLVSVNGPLSTERGIEVLSAQVRPDGALLAELLARTVTGELPVRLDRTVAFDDITDAFARVAEQGSRGRVVVLP